MSCGHNGTMRFPFREEYRRLSPVSRMPKDSKPLHIRRRPAALLCAQRNILYHILLCSAFCLQDDRHRLHQRCGDHGVVGAGAHVPEDDFPKGICQRLQQERADEHQVQGRCRGHQEESQLAVPAVYGHCLYSLHQ